MMHKYEQEREEWTDAATEELGLRLLVAFCVQTAKTPDRSVALWLRDLNTWRIWFGVSNCLGK